MDPEKKMSDAVSLVLRVYIQVIFCTKKVKSLQTVDLYQQCNNQNQFNRFSDKIQMDKHNEKYNG